MWRSSWPFIRRLSLQEAVIRVAVIIIEAELDGRECNLAVIGADFIPKTGETIWVRHEPFQGHCFHVVVESINGEVFKVEEL